MSSGRTAALVIVLFHPAACLDAAKAAIATKAPLTERLRTRSVSIGEISLPITGDPRGGRISVRRPIRVATVAVLEDIALTISLGLRESCSAYMLWEHVALSSGSSSDRWE